MSCILRVCQAYGVPKQFNFNCRSLWGTPPPAEVGGNTTPQCGAIRPVPMWWNRQQCGVSSLDGGTHRCTVCTSMRGAQAATNNSPTRPLRRMLVISSPATSYHCATAATGARGRRVLGALEARGRIHDHAGCCIGRLVGEYTASAKFRNLYCTTQRADYGMT